VSKPFRADNGYKNRLRPEDRSVHDWYRFVLSFPPHLVETYLERFGVTPGMRVLDPFCGTGTTLVECKKLGISSVGIERNPMACFASLVKLNWRPESDELVSHAREVARSTLAALVDDGINDEAGLPLFRPNGREPAAALRRLCAEEQALLLKGSIDPLPLHKTLVLLDSIHKHHEHHDPRYSDHERLAAAKAIVFDISNLQFGPEVGVGPAKGDFAVIAPWLKAVRTMAEDLRYFKDRIGTEAIVHQADARQISQILPARSVDIVITSPPYPNEKDYTRTTRLESVLLGFIRNRKELRALKQDLVRSNTRSVYRTDRDDKLVAKHPEVPKNCAGNRVPSYRARQNVRLRTHVCACNEALLRGYGAPSGRFAPRASPWSKAGVRRWRSSLIPPRDDPDRSASG
jgi:hypothetical protein